MRKITVAIDGYSGTGKSSTAKLVAKQLGYTYVDTGAMYRAITLLMLQQHVNLDEPQEIIEVLKIEPKLNFSSQRIQLNGLDVEDLIRSGEVNQQVSKVSAISEVRKLLVSQQRIMGENKGVVMDGRDIGSVVFPNAELKVFMTADPKVRAERRQLELKQKGIIESLDSILANLLVRDQLDSTREDSPLVQVDDAIEIDTSNLTLNQQVERIVELAKGIIDEH